jgi:hypothetical protein
MRAREAVLPRAVDWRRELTPEIEQVALQTV